MSHRFSGWVGAVVLVLAANAACGSRDSLFVIDDEQPSSGAGGGHAGNVNVGGTGNVNAGGHAGTGVGGRIGVSGFGGANPFGGNIGFAGSFSTGGAVTAFGGSGGFGAVGGNGFSCAECLSQNTNPCAVPACDFANSRCISVPTNEGFLCASGDLCSQSLCEAGQCVPTLMVTCPGPTSQCTIATCDPKSGACVEVPSSGTACDDGDPCTAQGKCSAGACLPGAPTLVCQNNDKCCPAGCSSATDNDCHAPSMVTLVTSDRGWYDSTGFHDTANKNTYTGYSQPVRYNSFFIFDLTKVTGTIVTAALTLEQDSYYGTNMSETASIWDVSASANTVSTTTPQNLVTFQDLQSGNQYGSFSGSQSTIGTLITTQLNAKAVADLNAARGRSFVVGVHIDTLSNPPQANEGLRFSMAEEARKNQLTLSVQ